MSKVIDLTGRPQSEWYSNPNLLDNWYFADPIDQRQGYVVPPGTAYYSDTGLSAQAGTVAAYTTAEYVDGVYGSVTVDGVTGYVDWTAAVRGHTNVKTFGQYLFDRWLGGQGTTVTLGNTGVTGLPGQTFRAQIYTYLENPEHLYGKIVTQSILFNGKVYSVTKTLPAAPLIDTTTIITDGIMLYIYQGSPSTGVSVGVRVEVGYSIENLVAMKLELGSTQTLAHQDADGNWVLNDPPPNRALVLAKCQRYYQLFSSADARPANLADYRPVMRVNPALGTINVNGQNMYFADANL